MICSGCGNEIPDGADMCKSCGSIQTAKPESRLSQNAKNAPDYGRTLRIINKALSIAMWLVFGGFALYVFCGPEPPARGKSHFTACFEQLSHVKTGTESYLSENNDLRGLDPYGDRVCNHILAGYAKASECKGLVAARVVSVCDNFKITYLNDIKGNPTNYEITGNATDRTKCGIVITEMRGMPEKYDDCTEDIPPSVH